MAEGGLLAVSGSGGPVRVSLVLPCLNEEQSLAGCIADAKACIGDIDLEIIVVDNGSTDRSVDVARRAGARVLHEAVRGYGSAIRRGIVEAHGEIIVMADADSTYELAAIPRLVQPILDGDADLVLGERLASATADTMPVLHRRLGTPLLSLFVRQASRGVAVSDSQSGFRAFRRDTFLTLQLQSNGMEFASEMLVRAGQRGLRILEVPTMYSARLGESKLSTFRDGARHLRLLVLLAPQVVLKWPGIIGVVLGMLSMGLGAIDPQGLSIGSAHWQPVFFGPILVVVGSLLLVATAAVQRFSPLAERDDSSSLAEARSIYRFGAFGGLLFVAGIGLDIALSMADFEASEAAGRRLALASIATSALMVGAVILTASMVAQMLLGQRLYADGLSTDSAKLPADA